MTTPLFQEAKPAPEPAPEPVDELAPDENAPHGYLIDKDGTKRPKMRPGRQRKDAPAKAPVGQSPSLDELKAMKDASAPKAAAKEDVAPQPRQVKSAGKSLKDGMAKMTAAPATPFRAGPIAKGVNRIYKKAGKIIGIWDRQVGKALILCTQKDDEDDTSVGEAWEELARVNPRIRGFLERLIQGGAWTALFYAHVPFLLAIMMKDSIQSRIPLARVVTSFMADQDDEDQGDEDGPGLPGPLAGLMGDLQPGDMAQMMQMAQGMMQGLAQQMPRQPEAPAREPAA